MDAKGFMGKILTVDLAERRAEAIPLSKELAEDYIGGGGMAAKIISERLVPQMDPLSAILLFL
jgi:aldehyde:ferredoxin oxidoreductase